MKCADYEELLSAYLDKETSLLEQETVSRHLQSCRSCRTLLDDLAQTRSLVRGLKRFSAPPELWETIKSRTLVGHVVPLFVRVSRGLVALAASLVILVGLITLLGYVAPEPVSIRESNMYLGGHAYHLMRQPLADHSSWSYVAGESNFELLAAEE